MRIGSVTGECVCYDRVCSSEVYLIFRQFTFELGKEDDNDSFYQRLNHAPLVARKEKTAETSSEQL